MTEALSSIMAYGYIFIVGFVFVLLLIQLLSFYTAGKMTGSINDEFMSAFTLFGAMIILSMVSGLINAVLSLLLNGVLIPGIIAFVLYLGLAIFAVMRIYDLSGGKSFLFLIISFLMTVVVTGLIGYGAFKFLPKGEPRANTDSGFNMTDDADLESDFGTESETDVVPGTDIDAEADKLLEDAAESETGEVGTEAATETVTETIVTTEPETAPPSGPKLPGTPAVSGVSCIADADCLEANESCVNGFCAVTPLPQ